jgi:flagellar basal body-associated protein FliL
MEATFSNRKEKGTLRDWIIVVAMAVLFLVWGFLIFFMVGDKGSPSWDFGVIKDIPGESPYSTERPSR